MRLPFGALCARSAEPDIWFSEPASPEGQRAIATCKECPVSRQCGDAAGERREAYGIWGDPTPIDSMAYGKCRSGHPRAVFGRRTRDNKAWRCLMCDYAARNRNHSRKRDAQLKEQGVS